MGGARGATGMPSLLCPALVGREDETAALHRRLDATAHGRGGVVLLVGDAGTGKSRLVRETAEAARAQGVRVLAGRAVPGGSPVPYRPLTEAFLAAFRSTPPPAVPALAGFAPHLGRLVPAWRADAPAAADDSPVLVGEAVVRLLRHLDRCVLVVEDVHWADAETVAVLDHLADALPDEPVLVLATTRPGGAAAGLRERLPGRDPASVLAVDPLDAPGVDRMLATCLRTPSPPPEVGAFLRAQAEGVPLLVEELLAGLVAAGELRFEDDQWVSDGELTPRVPASLRESVARRADHLDPVARRVVAAAAVLGRRFAWELLPGIAEVDGREVVEGLRAAVAQQLVAVDEGGFAFRHALTREAVLDDLLPPERRDLARRAWPALERAHPGLPGSTCELAAELAEAAGDPMAAATRLVTAARRALAAGAVASAEVTARRARRLALPDDAVVRDVDELTVDVLVAAGKPRAALDLGHDLAARMTAAAAEPERRLALLLTLARAGVGAGDPGAAARLVEEARAAGPAVPALDAVAAHVALEQGHHDDAAALAHRALDAAMGAEQPAVECEAAEVLGRVARDTDLAAARRWFARAADVAGRAGLATWHLRAQQETALVGWDTATLRTTREVAARYGALTTVALMDLSLADLALGRFDRAGALEAARACVAASRRYGLATAPVAHLWLAGAHALAGDDDAMEAAVAAALAPDPSDPRILGDLHGRVLATRAFVVDDLDALRGHVDAMMVHVRAADPSRSVFPGRALWAVVHAAEDDDLGLAARTEFGEVVTRLGMDVFRYAHDAAEAVAQGRTGAGAEAHALVERARAVGLGLDGGDGVRHCLQLLVARAAVRDGWGDPVAWLRESEAFFAAAGLDRTARRCRRVMREAGAPVPRKGRGTSIVPPPLRALGVTSREVDVLGLVALGLSNPEIGARLFLSPRTVERHLGNLFARTGVHDRGALGDLARAHGVQGG